ncbi:MAG: hypothetical protein N3E48_00155 [Candidatus Bathyarchaeota archaeon]|nr:hypothetical protein [Candidatus Bathyarchaeota archaeon]
MPSLTVYEILEENSIVVASYHEIVDLMRSLRRDGGLPKGSAAILSESEPKIEEATGIQYHNELVY